MNTTEGKENSMRNVWVAMMLILMVALPAMTQDTVIVRDTTVMMQRDTTENQTLTGSEAGIKNTLGLGPRVGYYKSTEAQEGGYYVGAQLRLRLGAYVGLEGAVDIRGKDLYELGRRNDTAITAEVRYVPVTASFLLFIPVSFNFAPYGLAGVGWYYSVVDYPQWVNNLPPGERVDDKTDYKFGYHFGFGLELPLSRNFSLNGDYRYQFIGSPFKNEGSVEVNPKNSNGSVITAGLMIYF